MHKIFRILTLTVLVLGVLVTPALAQTDQWSMYLYNGNTGELVRVFADATQQTYTLDLPENGFISSRDMAFSADGNRVAYCVISYPTSSGDQPALPDATLFVRDLVAGTNLLEQDLGNAIGCATGQAGLSADMSQVTVALANYFPQDPAADLTKPAWQILVLDVASGSILQELNTNSQPVLDIGLMMEGAMLPQVRVFQNNQVVFAAVPYGIGGTPQVTAYRWDIGTGTLAVEPEGAFNHFGADVLPATNEAVWTGANPNLPAAEPAGPVGYGNVVMLAAGSAEPVTIYHSPDWTLIAAKFINGGTHVAVLHFPSYDPNQPIGAQLTKWVAVDRGGNAVDLQTGVEYSDIAAAPQGYAFLRTSYPDPNNAELVRFSLEYYQGSQMTELWSSETPTWEIAWSAQTPVPADLPPFTAQ